MRRVTALFASVAITLALTSATATAQPQKDTIDTSLPTQLPREAVPHHYSITVTPRADKLSFDGSVAIDIQVLKATRTLTLNAADLTFDKATITPAGRGSFCCHIEDGCRCANRHIRLRSDDRTRRLPPRHRLLGQGQHAGQRPFRTRLQEQGGARRACTFHAVRSVGRPPFRTELG